MPNDSPSPDELHTQVQHRLIEELQEAESRHRELLDSLPEVVLQCDGEGSITYLNPAWESLLGYSRSDSIGTSLSDYILEKDRAQWNGFPEAGAPDQTSHIRLKRQDGSIRWFLAGLRRSPKGVCSGLLQDISEQVELAQQLRQAQKMEAIGRLAGGVAHDFNNLLTVIIGGAEAALQFAPDSDARLQDDLKLVIEAGERASTLTRQLLAFGRRQVMQFRVVRLKDLVEEMETILKHMVGDQVEIEMEDHCSEGRVSVDPDQMQQVITNLVVNARDAMSGKGRILFGLSDLEIGNEGGPPELSVGPHVVLSVSDQGRGIEESDLEKIFEPFFTTKEEGKGTGLGLATCHGIVSQNRGAMDVTSELGVGTTFRVYLPAA